MWLVVGLGNPGSKYLLTRHNIGFMAVDAFLTSTGQPSYKTEKKAVTYHMQLDDQKIIFAQPQTYMNLSGQSVQGLAEFYKIKPQNIIVIHDEIDQDFGVIRIQTKRGHGGHNGIRDINEKLGSNDYIRVRLGVGRPANPKMDVAAYVLQNFSKEEQDYLPDFLNKSSDAIESIIFDGFPKASSTHSGQSIEALK